MIIVLSIILACILAFLFIFHIPYVNYHTELNSIQSKLIQQSHLENIESFSEYNSLDTYYIVTTNTMFYIYNHDLDCIYRKQLSKLVFEDIQDSIDLTVYEKVNQTYGYENDKPCLVYTLYLEDHINYRYYNLETGQLMKMYSLKTKERE